MNADSVSMLEFLGTQKTIFEIPVYQRNYEWSRKQCQKLFKDMELLINNPNKNHFLGTIVYIPESGNKLSKIKRIIDGQQRITSYMLLLKAISVSADKNIKDEITDLYLRNKYLSQNNHLKLRSVELDRNAYINVINNSISNSDPSKIISNYFYFKHLIDHSNYPAESLLNALRRMNIAYIELDNNPDSENPQVIFEAINSTGVSLSYTDLIRNFLFMGISGELQNNLYHNYWIKIEKLLSDNTISDFVRHYLIMKTHKNISKNKVYNEYKRFFTYNQYTSSDAVKELYKYAIYYNELKNSKTDNNTFNKIINNINMLNNKVVYPYLMKLLELKNDKEIQSNTLISIGEEIESYLYRSFICDYTNKHLDQIIAALCSPINSNDELNRLEVTLLQNDFPTNREFKEALVYNKLYKKGNASTAKITLENIEKHLSKETVDFNDAQIEHIMPQRLSDNWRISVNNADKLNDRFGDTLGNLTLTKYNQNMGNNTYDNKKKFYKESNIYITRNLSYKYPKWNRENIINRAETLSNIVLNIWTRPKRNVKQDNIKGEYNLYDNPDVTGHQPTKLIIGDTSYSVTSWVSILITMFNYVWEYNSEDFNLLKLDTELKESVLKKKEEISRPQKLVNGEIIETRFNSRAILSIIKKISNIYGITDSISYIVE